MIRGCPFCGGNGKISYRDVEFGGWNGKGDRRKKYRIQVICNKCHARGKPVTTNWLVNPNPYSKAPSQVLLFQPYVEHAIEEWNRRFDYER